MGRYGIQSIYKLSKPYASISQPSFTSSEVPSNRNISTYNPVIQGICLSSNNVVFLLANFEKYNGYLLLLKAVITSIFLH